MNNKNKAFSLLELMVVVVIIAVLAIVAIPSYRKYVLTSRVSTAIPVLENVRDQIISAYDINGSVDTIKVGDIELTRNNVPANNNAGTYEVVDITPIRLLRYSINTKKVIIVQGSLSGLSGIPDYSEPGTTATANSVLTIMAQEYNGAYKSVCGRLKPDGSTDDQYGIPTSYMPASCKCEDLRGFADGKAAACD